MAALKYRPAIDGLRALAVLSVFIFHLNHRWLSGGFVGVDVFFVISGFLITSIILKDCEGDTFSLAKFYQRRIARIFPAFFTVALVTLLGATFIYTPQDLASAGANLVATTLSVANLKFMLQGDYFAISIPLGIWIRQANYVNATFADVAKGGLVFPGKPGAPSVMLMGDSNGSMYGKVMKEICADLGYKLTVISVAAGDALPNTEGESSQLWDDSLEAVRSGKPDYLVIANLWTAKLAKQEQRLTVAVTLLRPFVGKMIILNQPPLLPANANRAEIRNGVRPPFIENPESLSQRQSINLRLHTLADFNAEIIDIAGCFQHGDGVTEFLDEQGRQLYHDQTHLSGFGAARIRPLLEEALLLPL